MRRIKHIVRDLIISLFEISEVASLYRARVRKGGPLVRVLCFHDVADRAWFASTLDFLAEHYQVITPEQFEKREFVPDTINILITFDDGYHTWVTHAAPELEARGMRGLFFVNSGLLDSIDTAAFYEQNTRISRKESLTWDDAQKLLAAGHIIGGHTVNHTRLSAVSIQEVVREVEEDKRRLEEQLSVSLAHFAYPFGTASDYTDDTIKVVREVGYRYQYSAATGFAREHDTELIIPRALIENNQSIRSIGMWVEGSYDIFARILGR